MTVTALVIVNLGLKVIDLFLPWSRYPFLEAAEKLFRLDVQRLFFT